MKKAALTILLAVNAAIRVHAQGRIAFDNQFNSNLTPDATNQGGVFDCGVLATGNFNASLYGGNSPTNLSLIVTLTQSSGNILSGDVIGMPGQWIDVTGQAYIVPGVPILGSGFFEVFAWEGNYDSYAAALAAGECAGRSGVFRNFTSSPTANTDDLTGMPSFDICPDCPEPGSLALCGLGAVSLLHFCRKKDSCNP